VATPEEVLQRGVQETPPTGGARGLGVLGMYQELLQIQESRAEDCRAALEAGLPVYTVRPVEPVAGLPPRTHELTTVQRGDGWVNLTTGAGTAGDRSQNTAFVRVLDLSVQLCVALYYQDDLAAKVCGAHVNEALRLPPKVTAPEGVPEETRKAVQDRLEVLHWANAAKQGATFARLLGDAWIFPCVEGEQAGPLAPGARVIAFKNFDRRDLLPYRWDMNALSPRYGEPDDYQIVAIWGSAQAAFVNHLRLIPFVGVQVDVWERLANGGYNHSVLNRALSVIKATQEAWDGVAYLLGEASMKVLSLKGLTEKLSNARAITLRRIADLNQTASNTNTAVISGAGEEELKRLEVGALTGLASTLEVMMGRLASVADMPVSILFGQAPGGLNAAVSGDVSTRAWYASVRGVQEHTLRRPMTAMVDLIAAEFSPEHRRGWGVEFPSLWDESPAERTAARKSLVDELVALTTAAIVTPEEAAIILARWDAHEENPYDGLDLEARLALVEGRYDPGVPPVAPAPIPQAPPGAPAVGAAAGA